MALARIDYQGDGATSSFSVPFEYIEQDHIEVTVDGVPTTYSWSSSQVVTVTPAPTGLVRVERKTPNAERMVDFEDGSVLGEEDLDLMNEQLFYVVQEYTDVAGDALKVATGIDAKATEALSKAETALTTVNAVAPKAQTALETSAAAKTTADKALDYVVGAHTLPTDLASAGGTSLVGYMVPLAGAVKRSLANRLGDTVSVKDFGAKGDGVTDDTAAFTAAMIGGLVYIPAGDYVVTDTITGIPTLFVGAGSGKTTIIFDNLAGRDGFAWTEATTVGETGGLVGVELVARGSNGGVAAKMPEASSDYFTEHTRWLFRDIYCRGSVRNTAAYSFAWDYGFATWFRLSDCTGLEVSHLTIHGQWDIKSDPSTQFQDCGIELSAASALLSARISDVNIGPIHTGVLVGDRAFFSLSTFDIIGAHRGIYQEAATPFNEPKISFGNINAQETGIYLADSSARDITSVTIRRHRQGWKGGTNDWFGIRAERSSNITISRCVIQPDEGAGPFPGTQTAVLLDTCGLGACSDNFIGVGCDIGYNLSNCSGMVFGETTSAQNAPTDVLFSLTNNTRKTTIGAYELVSTFVGSVLHKDSTITGAVTMLNNAFDLQGVSNVTLDMTRTNAGVDSKKWRQIVSTTQNNRQVLTDAGGATNYELVTRSAATINQIEWRAANLYLNGTTTTTKQIRPAADNVFTLGEAASRWGVVYAGTGTINTSDERAKQDIGIVPDAVLDAWAAVGYSQYRFIDALEAKGAEARLHVGLIAQRVKEAFEAAGLDPFAYGLLCYDEWDEQQEIVDEEGAVLQNYGAAGNRYGIRYEEALALEAALMRRTTQRLEARLAALEAS